MNKRIFSFVLSLIMLVSLVPVTALTASAAGLSTSENAITVLKQLEGYSKKCVNGITGYGTVCTKSGDHDDHITSETEANAALREKLKELDKAVNAFSGSLTQGQHDALVLFSFENGTGWTEGVGALQNAIKNGATGSELLTAFCMWDNSAADDDRRKIEVHMYLNTLYNSAVQTDRYRTITFNPNQGKIDNRDGNLTQYYDTAVDSSITIVPTRSGYDFMGWYNAETGKQVTSLKDIANGKTLTAKWQVDGDKPGNVAVNYDMTAADRVTLYAWKEVTENKVTKLVWEATRYQVKGALKIESEFIDANNVRWGQVKTTEKWYKEGEKQTAAFSRAAEKRWIKLGDVSFANGSGSATNYDIDVTVTVTNSYLRVRAEDSIYSRELRRASQGEQLRIVNTSSADGFLWGQIADNDNDGVCEGWVALMYTNFEEVRNTNSGATYNVVAVANVVKPVNGYVNVRSGAGTHNKIVGALPYKSRVNIYEIDYVNGIQWGRYDGGWFCLSYADVDGVNVDDYVNTSGVLAYAFTGKLLYNEYIYTQPGGTEVVDQDALIKAEKLKKEDKIEDGDTVTVTNLVADDAGNTWGKISVGWVMVTRKNSDTEFVADNVVLNTAKYYTVVDGVTVREEPKTSAARVNNLTKGVEFNVNDQSASANQIVVVGDSIWGYADKVGEGTKTYKGWVNLASKYVARGDAPSSVTTNTPTGEVATIVGADRVNVRIHHDTYSKILGKIERGTTVAILGEEDGWYKLDYDVDNDAETDSWVSGQYVQVSKAAANNGTAGTTGSTGTGTVETGLGIVANTYGGVNVRTGVGTGYPSTGKLLPGTTVEILEVTTHGTSKWGRCTQGWVCMDYITMVTNYEILGSLTGGTSGSNGTVTGAETAIYTGKTNGAVEVHKTTDELSDVVRTITDGPITMHELLTVNKETSEPDATDPDNKTIITKTTEYWARINDGYIKLNGTNVTLDTLDEAVYTVTESETLNVRPDAGTASGNAVFKLNKGDQVVITQLKIVNGSVWGMVEGESVKTYVKDEEGKETVEYDWNGTGWISLAYCTKGAIDVNPPVQNTPPVTQQPTLGAGSTTGGFVNNATGYRYTGKVINTNKVNVRATASQTATKTTELAQGASLVIYETVTSEGMAWGRCDAGWVYLYYVDLTPVVNGAVDARVVYNENTIAYTDMNMSAVAGTYSKMAVIDIYEIVGKMARTDLGWVSTDNLL